MNSDRQRMIARKIPSPFVVGAAALAAAVLVTTGCSGDQKPSYEITTVQRGSFGFTPSPEDLANGTITPEQCEGNVCGCEADIQRVKLLGGSVGDARINAVLDSQLPPPCDAYNQKVVSSPRVTYVSDRVASILTEQLVLGRGAGGGCHGSTIGQTFDRRTGNEIQLRDAVAPENLSVVLKLAAEEIATRQNQRSRGSAHVSDVEESLIRTQGRLGLVIDTQQGSKAAVRVQIGEFLFSCADGSNFSAAVPTKFITHPALKHIP